MYKQIQIIMPIILACFWAKDIRSEIINTGNQTGILQGQLMLNGNTSTALHGIWWFDAVSITAKSTLDVDAYNGDAAAGNLVIYANTVQVDGTLTADGCGYRGVMGNSGTPGQNAVCGSAGEGPFAGRGGMGGPGGTGGKGGDQVKIFLGQDSIESYGRPGMLGGTSSGFAHALAGGYCGLAGNSDNSTDTTLCMGSAGGTGGNGAGGGQGGKGAGPSGGAGGAGGSGGYGGYGGNGGGYIKIFANRWLHVNGRLSAQGQAGDLGTAGVSGSKGIAADGSVGSAGGEGGYLQYSGSNGRAGNSNSNNGDGGGGGGGGRGSNGGPGAGGGILLYCETKGNTVINGSLCCLGGDSQTSNGGTIKIFCPELPSLPSSAVQAGHVFIKTGPAVSQVTPRYAATHSRIHLIVRGSDFNFTTAIELKNAQQTIPGTALVVAGNSLSAWFELPALPGRFDMSLHKGANDFIFKNVFTLHPPLAGSIQWQVNDLGKAGNPASAEPSSIVIADADRDGQREVYVADHDRMIFQYKKDRKWAISYMLESTAEKYQQLLAADAGCNGYPELFAVSDIPQTYQLFWDKGWQSNSICAYVSPLALGDGNQDGENEFYAVSGNTTTGEGLVQYHYEGGAWQVSTVAGPENIYAFTALVAGDGDNDGADEVYAANQDHYLYQFKYANGHWQKIIVANSGNGKTTSLALGELEPGGKNELYAANEDGHIYQLKWTGSAWLSQALNKTPLLCRQISIGDADNDGQDELYAAGQDGHLYEFKFLARTWQRLDLGNAKTPLTALAVGDGDNDFQSEVYAVGANAHVFEFKAQVASTSKPTTALTPAVAPVSDADKKLQVFCDPARPGANESARIRWYQANNAPVTLEISNLNGHKIATLADKRIFTSGQLQEITWDGKNSSGAMASSGIYVVHISAGDYQDWALAKITQK